MTIRTIAAYYRPGLMTVILIVINLLVYGGMLWQGSDPLEPGSEDVLRWGGNYAGYLLQEQWWRLIASQFVHFGLMHLAMNLFILYNIGIVLEKYLGQGKFAMAYLLTGTCASLASLWWYRHEDVVSAGASGAIFGLYGVYIAILTTRLIPLGQRGPLLSSALTFVGYNIFFGFEPGVDNAAHLGGLFSGLVLGYSLYPILRSPILSSIIGKVMGMSSLAILIGCGTLLFANFQTPLNLAKEDTLIFYDLVDELFEKESELRTKGTKKDIESMAMLIGWKEVESLISEMQELTLGKEDALYRDELAQWVQRAINHYHRYSLHRG